MVLWNFLNCDISILWRKAPKVAGFWIQGIFFSRHFHSLFFEEKYFVLVLLLCNRSRRNIANMYWEVFTEPFWFNSSSVPPKNSIYLCFVIIVVVFLKSKLSIPMPLDRTLPEILSLVLVWCVALNWHIWPLYGCDQIFRDLKDLKTLTKPSPIKDFLKTIVPRIFVSLNKPPA